MNYLKKMVLSLFTTKISENLQLKCSGYPKVYVLKLRKDCFNLETKYVAIFISPVRTVFSGTGSIKFLGPTIWELIPDEMKELESLWEFKKAMKLWKPTSCPSRLCRQYFYRIGFL